MSYKKLPNYADSVYVDQCIFLLLGLYQARSNAPAPNL
jgi:hypothetical protein